MLDFFFDDEDVGGVFLGVFLVVLKRGLEGVDGEDEDLVGEMVVVVGNGDVVVLMVCD